MASRLELSAASRRLLDQTAAVRESTTQFDLGLLGFDQDELDRLLAGPDARTAER
jgi:hypothetical protein